MKRVVMICDVCGNEYKPNKDRFDTFKVLRRISEDEDDGYLDLCDNCQEYITHCLESRQARSANYSNYVDKVMVDHFRDMEARR